MEPVGSDRREKIDVRIIAATNKDLQEAIANEEFREDLFYRLGVILLILPPLRDRKEDIPGLVRHFLKKAGAPADVGFSKEALAVMKKYHWPGNIRELQNVVERCVILRRGNVIEKQDLNIFPSAPVTGFSIPDLPEQGISLDEVEKKLILKALAKSGGNRSEAARLLQIPRHVLIYRLEKFDIS